MKYTSKEKQKAIDVITSSFICKQILTIDPGKNGAIAKYSDNRLEVWNMDKVHSFEDLCDFFRYQKSICDLPLCFIEKITTYPGDASNTGKMYQLQKLKEHYTELRSALRTTGIPFIEVMPIHWQRDLNIRIKDEDYKIRKARFKDIAADWYPSVKATLKNCDAILLVEFARRKLKYKHLWIQEHINKPKTSRKLF